MSTRASFVSAFRSCSKPVFKSFQGKVQPSSTLSSAGTSTLDVIAEWTVTQANQDLWSALLLTIPGSANDIIKKIEGKRPEDGAGHGQAAWKVLTKKYNGVVLR